MAARKKPDLTITRDQLMAAEDLGDYLRLKFEQLGISQSAVGKAMGFTSGIMISRVITHHPEAKGYAGDKMHKLVELIKEAHATHGMPEYDIDEQTRMQQLNDNMPKPNPRFSAGVGRKAMPDPDPSVTTDDLLKTDTLFAFIELKRKQLGMTQKDVNNALDSNYSALGSGSRKSQYNPEDFGRLVGLFQTRSEETEGVEPMGEAEIAHVNALHAKLKPYSPPKPKKETPDDGKSYAPEDLLAGLGRYDKKNDCFTGIDESIHVVPSEAMLYALINKDADGWNRSKEALLAGNPGRSLYLRGFNAAILNVTSFDFSDCDMIDFEWPKNPSYSVPAALKNTVLISEGPDAENEYYHRIAMRTRMLFEKQNPDFDLAAFVTAPEPAAALNGSTPPPFEPPAGNGGGEPPLGDESDEEDMDVADNQPLPSGVVPIFEIRPDMTFREFVNAALASLQEQEPIPKKNHGWAAEQLGLSTIAMVISKGIKWNREDRLGRWADILNLTPEQRVGLARANEVTLGEIEIADASKPETTVEDCAHDNSLKAHTLSALDAIGKDTAWLAAELDIDEEILGAALQTGIKEDIIFDWMIEVLGSSADDETVLRLANTTTLNSGTAKHVINNSAAEAQRV